VQTTQTLRFRFVGLRLSMYVYERIWISRSSLQERIQQKLVRSFCLLPPFFFDGHLPHVYRAQRCSLRFSFVVADLSRFLVCVPVVYAVEAFFFFFLGGGCQQRQEKGEEREKWKRKGEALQREVREKTDTRRQSVEQ
jgi:hypothetical protein